MEAAVKGRVLSTFHFCLKTLTRLFISSQLRGLRAEIEGVFVDADLSQQSMSAMTFGRGPFDHRGNEYRADVRKARA